MIKHRLFIEVSRYAKIAWPLILNNLVLAGMQFADTVMVGQLGAEELAAVAVGSAVWFFGFCVSMGLLMAVSASVAVSFGEEDFSQIGVYHRQGYFFAALCSIFIIVTAQYWVPVFLSHVGVVDSFRQQAVAYVQAIAWGAPGMMLFLVLRFTTEGVGRTKPIMSATLVALVLNIFLNYLFIYGKYGMPALGAEGAGVASAITNVALGIGMAIYLAKSSFYKHFKLWQGNWRPDLGLQKALFKLGAPIAVAMAAEVGLFNAVAILMGTLGASVAASHQIAINFASTTFMIPMAISAAATVRVGHLLGAKQLEQARYSAWVGVGLCVSVMLVSALTLLFYRDVLVGWYTPVVEVATLAIDMLAVAAIFQIVDGVQVGASGVLRAYKDTRVPMLITLFAYWVCAFPCAYVFAVVWQLPPTSIWWGFVIGLGIAAVFMLLRMHVTSAKRMVNIHLAEGV